MTGTQWLAWEWGLVLAVLRGAGALLVLMLQGAVALVIVAVCLILATQFDEDMKRLR